MRILFAGILLVSLLACKRTTGPGAGDEPPSCKVIYYQLIPTSAERVYQVWLDSAQLGQWFQPLRFVTSQSIVDATDKKAFYLKAAADIDNHHYEISYMGRFLELIPNQRIKFNLAYSISPNLSTLVTADLIKVAGGTLVVLVQENLPIHPDCANVFTHWMESLDRLAKIASAGT